MNIDDLTLGQVKELKAMFGTSTALQTIDNKMIGKYVIVRCRDAGVHAGVLESHVGRECVITNTRRLWYWKPAEGKKFLSGVAVHGLHSDSKVGVEVPRTHLTENCEIIECTDIATKSIREIEANE